MTCVNSPFCFGSNQVDFGGMISPASAIAIRSWTVTGNMLKATAPAPLLTIFSSSPVAADAADELDALVGALVANPEQRREHEIVQARDVERRDRARARGGFAAGVEPQRATRRRDTSRIRPCARRCRAGLDGNFRAQRGKERRRRVAREILHHAVIRQDLQALLRERDAEEPRVLADEASAEAAAAPAPPALPTAGVCAAKCACPRGARRAIVRDIQRRHVLERRHDRGAYFGLGPPDRVLDAVRGREIVERRRGGALRDGARERVLSRNVSSTGPLARACR